MIFENQFSVSTDFGSKFLHQMWCSRCALFNLISVAKPKSVKQIGKECSGQAKNIPLRATLSEDTNHRQQTTDVHSLRRKSMCHLNPYGPKKTKGKGIRKLMIGEDRICNNRIENKLKDRREAYIR